MTCNEFDTPPNNLENEEGYEEAEYPNAAIDFVRLQWTMSYGEGQLTVTYLSIGILYGHAQTISNQIAFSGQVKIYFN